MTVEEKAVVDAAINHVSGKIEGSWTELRIVVHSLLASRKPKGIEPIRIEGGGFIPKGKDYLHYPNPAEVSIIEKLAEVIDAVNRLEGKQ
jgi:hypothetical protein